MPGGDPSDGFITMEVIQPNVKCEGAEKNASISSLRLHRDSADRDDFVRKLRLNTPGRDRRWRRKEQNTSIYCLPMLNAPMAKSGAIYDRHPFLAISMLAD